MRGNLDYRIEQSGFTRSIPACAGEPATCYTRVVKGKVYPRVCGGTAWGMMPIATMAGLSPRVRGNQFAASWNGADVGSIPACAGEPAAYTTGGNVNAVYPRVCGGTQSCHFALPAQYGLSPRVRGNRPATGNAAGVPRSIPACAGEPPQRWREILPQRVYPRVCGGTSWGFQTSVIVPGLSPRVRGNRLPATPNLREVRSIPACAGEPNPTRAGVCPHGVYPRVCGGTFRAVRAYSICAGLSPRVRGNRQD